MKPGAALGFLSHLTLQCPTPSPLGDSQLSLAPCNGGFFLLPAAEVSAGVSLCPLEPSTPFPAHLLINTVHDTQHHEASGHATHADDTTKNGPAPPWRLNEAASSCVALPLGTPTESFQSLEQPLTGPDLPSAPLRLPWGALDFAKAP